MGAGLHGLNGVNPKVAMHLIQIYVMPRLQYGLEITTLRQLYLLLTFPYYLDTTYVLSYS
jgi:hypothetical protein